MFKKKINNQFIYMAIFLSAFILGIVFGLFNINTKGNKIDQQDFLVDNIKSVCNLATVEYNYTYAYKYKEDGLIDMLDKSVVVKYDGKIKIGIKLDSVIVKDKQYEGDQLTGVTIKLPHATVLDNSPDYQSMVYILDDKLSSSAYDTILNDLKEKPLNDLESNAEDIYHVAEQNAINDMTQFIKELYTGISTDNIKFEFID